jgi:transcription factor E2F6
VQTRKRRIYDVTNVLEGVGLIRKTGTNTVQWVTPDESSPLSTRRFREVHARRLSRLRSLQERMEGCIAALKQSIHTLTSIPENMRMLYVTRRDLLNLEGLRGCAAGVRNRLHAAISGFIRSASIMQGLSPG